MQQMKSFDGMRNKLALLEESFSEMEVRQIDKEDQMLTSMRSFHESMRAEEA